jgi:hypothetical protein
LAHEEAGDAMDIDDGGDDMADVPILDDPMVFENGSVEWLRSMVVQKRTFTVPIGNTSLVMADFNIDNMKCTSTPVMVRFTLSFGSVVSCWVPYCPIIFHNILHYTVL